MYPPASPRFYAIATMIVLACISIFVAYARIIPCEWCHEPWAIFPAHNR
jgi:hypothetical protein